MTNRAETHPELWALFQKLQKQRTDILAKHAPARAKQDRLRRQQEALKEEELKLIAPLKADRDALTDIDVQLAGLAKSMGGQALNS